MHCLHFYRPIQIVWEMNGLKGCLHFPFLAHYMKLVSQTMLSYLKVIRLKDRKNVFLLYPLTFGANLKFWRMTGVSVCVCYIKVLCCVVLCTYLNSVNKTFFEWFNNSTYSTSQAEKGYILVMHSENILLSQKSLNLHLLWHRMCQINHHSSISSF